MEPPSKDAKMAKCAEPERECPIGEFNKILSQYNDAANRRHEEVLRKLQHIEDGNTQRDKSLGMLEDAMYGNGRPGVKQELLELRVKHDVLSAARNKIGSWIVPALVGGVFTVLGYALLAGVSYYLQKS